MKLNSNKRNSRKEKKRKMKPINDNNGSKRSHNHSIIILH